MVSHLVFYQFGLITLVWLFLMLYRLWPRSLLQLAQCHPSR